MRRAIFKKVFYLVLLFLIFILMVMMPPYVSPYTIIFLSSIFMYIVLTVSWALFSGPTHYLSLASAAFFGLGIYVSAILGDQLPLLVVIGLGGLISFLLALLVGLSSLRLKGMYFTIFTFGLSELIRHSVQWWEVNKTGTVGRWVIAVDHTTVYYVMLGILLTTLVVTYIIKHSKYGLALLSIGESEEAADHIGINVNAICPGTIDSGIVPESLKQRSLRTIPKGRLGLPEDIASAVVFLASPESDYITGSVLVVDGGISKMAAGSTR